MISEREIFRQQRKKRSGFKKRKRADKPDRPISCIEGSYCGVFEADDEQRCTTRIGYKIAIMACRCRSQFCEECRVGAMVRWREKLRPVVASWERVRMVTLTIDRKRWNGPQEAYEAIQKKRAVVEFVKKLHRPRVGLLKNREFFYAIEFHKTGGWVHWHVALRPKGRWPNKGDRDWREFGDRLSALWGHGFAQASDEHKSTSPEHAMHYLTKYIAKQDVGCPKWLLNRSGNFRKFSTSRGLCGPTKSKKAKRTTRGNKKNTPQQRIDNCRQASKVVQIFQFEKEVMGGVIKGKKYRHIGKLEVPFAEIEADENVQKALLSGDYNLGVNLADRKSADVSTEGNVSTD